MKLGYDKPLYLREGEDRAPVASPSGWEGHE
jgi:hypothetical protein